ncbi:hypothetical protein THAOC_08086, partial [Thalassiosira oceanica]
AVLPMDCPQDAPTGKNCRVATAGKFRRLASPYVYGVDNHGYVECSVDKPERSCSGIAGAYRGGKRNDEQESAKSCSGLSAVKNGVVEVALSTPSTLIDRQPSQRPPSCGVLQRGLSRRSHAEHSLGGFPTVDEVGYITPCGELTWNNEHIAVGKAAAPLSAGRPVTDSVAAVIASTPPAQALFTSPARDLFGGVPLKRTSSPGSQLGDAVDKSHKGQPSFCQQWCVSAKCGTVLMRLKEATRR